jgi:hypothetical protein
MSTIMGLEPKRSNSTKVLIFLLTDGTTYDRVNP